MLLGTIAKPKPLMRLSRCGGIRKFMLLGAMVRPKPLMRLSRREGLRNFYLLGTMVRPPARPELTCSTGFAGFGGMAAANMLDRLARDEGKGNGWGFLRSKLCVQ